MGRVRLSRTLYPVAHWVEGSEIKRSFWGFTKAHAARRAEQWGRANKAGKDQ